MNKAESAGIEAKMSFLHLKMTVTALKNIWVLTSSIKLPKQETDTVWRMPLSKKSYSTNNLTRSSSELVSYKENFAGSIITAIQT